MPRYEHMPHQLTGAAFLADRGFAFLWDEPGLGKTATSILAADKVGARKILVECPAVVRQHWAEEFATWQTIDRPITVVDGFVKTPPGEGVTIVSHACMADIPPPPTSRSKRKTRDVYAFPALLAGAPYDALIIDEAHEFRDYNATRARHLWMPDGLWTGASRTWALTGTPLVNSAADLWLPAFGPMGMPVSWWDWINRFTEVKQGSYDDIKPVGIRNQRDLADILRPHALHRTLDSIGLSLPPLTIETTPVALPQEAVDAVMAAMAGWTPSQVEFAIAEGNELRDSAIAKVRHALGVAKVPFTAEHTLNLLKSGEGPLVVFFQHTEVRKRLFDILRSQGYAVSWIDGTVTRTQLRAAVDWFQTGRLDVLLVQTQAGGMGLTLTRSHRAIIAELPWTSVALRQAIKRIHRIGQEAACTADVLRADGCWLEDLLATVVARKEIAANSLLSLLVNSQ